MQTFGLGQAHEVASLLAARAHRFLAEDVQAALQGQAGVFVVQGVRRTDDDGIQARMVDQFFRAFGGKLEAELLFDLAQLRLPEPADRRQLDIVALGQQRHMVRRRPPAGADEAEVNFGLRPHALVPDPRLAPVRRTGTE